VSESDGTPTIRPTNAIVFNSADFVVTDNGTSARIDAHPGAGANLTDTYVGFGDAANLLTGSSNFTFTEDAGSGPVLLLTGENPRLTMQDDTAGGDAPYLTQLQQSGASLYFVAQDDAGTNNEMMRMANSYIALMRSMDANVGIGTVPQSNVALHVLGDDSTEPAMILESNSTDGDFAPELRLWRNSASPVAGDYVGGLTWYIEDDGGGASEISAIKGYVGATTAGAESADMYWYVRGGGTSWNMLALRGASRLVEVNVSNHDIDFIANGDSVSDLFYVDASEDNIGIGGTPDSSIDRLHVQATTDSTEDCVVIEVNHADTAMETPAVLKLTNAGAGNCNFKMVCEAGTDSDFEIVHDAYGNTYFHSNQPVTGTIQQIALRPTDITFNEGGADMDIRFESVGNTDMLKIDSNNDQIGIGAGPASGGAQFQVDEDASFVSYLTNQNTTGLVDASLQKNGHIICNPSGGNIVVTLGGSGAQGEKVTICNVAADGSNVLLAVAVGDSTLTTPTTFVSGDSETWLCYKDNNWMRINFQT
jgi:hypothetical protein